MGRFNNLERCGLDSLKGLFSQQEINLILDACNGSMALSPAGVNFMGDWGGHPIGSLVPNILDHIALNQADDVHKVKDVEGFKQRLLALTFAQGFALQMFIWRFWASPSEGASKTLQDIATIPQNRPVNGFTQGGKIVEFKV